MALIRSHYITALLLVLAATGMEAQALEAALKSASNSVSINEICQRPEFRALQTDILSALKTFSQQKQSKKKYPNSFTSNSLFAILSASPAQVELSEERCFYGGADNAIMRVIGSINIRGPDKL